MEKEGEGGRRRRRDGGVGRGILQPVCYYANPSLTITFLCLTTCTVLGGLGLGGIRSRRD